MIPRLLHFVWVGPELPSWGARCLSEWQRLNPDYEIIIHDETSLIPEFIDLARQAKHPATVSDLIRYSILYRHGGWYFDVDFFPFRPLDDAVRAWGLDGEKVFVSKIRGHDSGEKLPLANGILGCVPGAPGMAAIIAAVNASTASPDDRCAYGPQVISDVVAEAPGLYRVAEPGWWFPLGIDQVMPAIPYLAHGRAEELRVMRYHTDGQIPFGAHLWAGSPRVNLPRAFSKSPDDAKTVLTVPTPKGLDNPIEHIVKGLAELGYEVTYRLPVENSPEVTDPDLVIEWNGLRESDLYAKIAREAGVPCLYVEHGFFNRREFSQVDHKGILHHSGRREEVAFEEPPPGAIDRLSRHFSEISPMGSGGDPDGYCLILGQVDGDSQLFDSEIKGAAQLCMHVSRALPDGIRAIFRPHPHGVKIQEFQKEEYRPIEFPDPSPSAGTTYSVGMQSPTLAKALAGARFCIAINSNALVEATAAGISCMAFGPSLGILAGAYKRTTLASLASDLLEMVNGWRPADSLVNRYLQWLACLQFSKSELEDPATLLPILQRAGVEVVR